MSDRDRDRDAGAEPRRTLPARIAERPSPDDWKEDELLTLAEAAALFWPDGLLTTTSLRHAVKNQKLEVVEVAGKILTNRAAIAKMSVCRLRARPDRGDEP